VLAKALHFLRSVHSELKSKSELLQYSSRSIVERDASKACGQEKIAEAISVKSRARASGFGCSNLSSNMPESDTVKNTHREIDTNIKMNSLGTETKPPEMEGTKALPSAKPPINPSINPSITPPNNPPPLGIDEIKQTNTPALPEPRPRQDPKPDNC
jgi:hypothetical protein